MRTIYPASGFCTFPHRPSSFELTRSQSGQKSKVRKGRPAKRHVSLLFLPAVISWLRSPWTATKQQPCPCVQKAPADTCNPIRFSRSCSRLLRQSSPSSRPLNGNRSQFRLLSEDEDWCFVQGGQCMSSPSSRDSQIRNDHAAEFGRRSQCPGGPFISINHF